VTRARCYLRCCCIDRRRGVPYRGVAVEGATTPAVVVLRAGGQKGAVAFVLHTGWYDVHARRNVERGARSLERWATVGVVLHHFVHTAVAAGYNSP
jgi:hypothetical protein